MRREDVAAELMRAWTENGCAGKMPTEAVVDERMHLYGYAVRMTLSWDPETRLITCDSDDAFDQFIVERAIRAVVGEFEAAARPIPLTDATLFAVKAKAVEITADLAQRFAAAKVVRP